MEQDVLLYHRPEPASADGTTALLQTEEETLCNKPGNQICFMPYQGPHDDIAPTR
jgi:hypothetical protein